MSTPTIPMDVHVMNKQVTYLIGYRDGEKQAKGLSVADTRERLSAIAPLVQDVYTRGLRNALLASLVARDPGQGVRRGQGGTCTGLLSITLAGPKGSGKAMVRRILEVVLPLLPLSRFEILESEEG
jgi:hypothetical protein